MSSLACLLEEGKATSPLVENELCLKLQNYRVQNS